MQQVLSLLVVPPPLPLCTEKAGPKVRELRQQLNQKQQETEGKYGAAVAVAKRHLSRALVEERTWYCSFMDMFGKVMVRQRGGAGSRVDSCMHWGLRMMVCSVLRT